MVDGHENSRNETPSMGKAPSTASSVADIEAAEARLKPGVKRIPKYQDVVFLAVFCLFAIGFIVETSFGFNEGNPLRLVHGVDYKGNVCGDRRATPGLKELGVLYWVNPAQLFLASDRTGPFKLPRARSVCLNNCPTLGNATIAWVCDYPEGATKAVTTNQWIKRKYNYFDLLTPSQQESSMKFGGPCFPVLFESTNVFWRCQLAPVPDNRTMQLWKSLNGSDVPSGPLILKAVDRSLTSPSATLQRYIADLGRAWPVLLLFGGLIPLLFSVIWLLLLCHFLRPTVWITLALLNILALLVTLFFYVKVGWIGHDAVSAVIGSRPAYDIRASSYEQTHLKIVSVFVTFALILTILVTVALTNRISSAMAIMKVALQSVVALPSVLIYPLVPFFFMGLFLIYWVSATLYLFSAGEVEGSKFHPRKHIFWAILYHFFCLYWVTQFILASTVTTVAGAIASRYWAKGETTQWNASEGMSWKGMGWSSIVSTGKHVMQYNLGSMALGSLVVPPIEFAQFLLQTLRTKLKSAETTMPNGTIVSSHGSSGACCLGCLDWTLTRINRNAFVVIAVSGREFCKAAQKATKLVGMTKAKVGAVIVIGDLFLFLGKLSVSFACALFAFLMLDTHRYKASLSRVSSPLFPVLFCWGFAYITASLFVSAAEMAVDTVLLSFCMDSKENKGTAIFAPACLVENLNTFTERHEATEAARNFRKYRSYEEDHYEHDGSTDRNDSDESS